MILKKTGRRELIGLLEGVAGNASFVVTRRNGHCDSVVKVDERDNGVFLCTFEKGNPVLSMAKMMGSNIHEHTVGEIVSELKRCKSEDVWLQWPTDSPSVVVGAVLSFGSAGRMASYVFPVPSDIENVNEEVRNICARDCAAAREGLQCGECPKLMDCKIIESADREIQRRRDGVE